MRGFFVYDMGEDGAQRLIFCGLGNVLALDQVQNVKGFRLHILKRQAGRGCCCFLCLFCLQLIDGGGKLIGQSYFYACQLF